jgi:2-polyprenyl-3-methyl-5-hydroxy-6-metoxy-1,4-benzoquinol methylase
MERIVEPELMDDPLQARAYAEADFDRSDQAFTERFLGLLGQPFPRPGPQAMGPGGSPGGRSELDAGLGSGWGSREGIVDLGCGPGNISFRLAVALPRARVLGIDGAASMVALAAEHQQRHPGAWPQLRFQQLKLPLADSAALGGPFAAVVSNSLLHHLHDPQVLWQAVGQLAAPGATIYIKDLRRPASAEAADALTERHAAGAAAVLRRDFRASLAAAFTVAEVEAQLARAAQLWGGGGTKGTIWPTFTVAEVEDRYLEIHGHWLG